VNGDQARAVLPVLRDHYRPLMDLNHRWTVSFAKLQKEIEAWSKRMAEQAEKMAKALQPVLGQVARYDAEQKAKLRHQMIYGRLDGRRPKR
jgi:hypothetical protein